MITFNPSIMHLHIHINKTENEKKKTKTKIHNKNFSIYNITLGSGNRHSVADAYLKENPDIILINSHGAINQEKIKIENYNIHKTNTQNELHSGVAIAVRRDIHTENRLVVIT